ncbi:hypothetical protein EV175_004478 [Coemansia sp. RSA 1933]|nr:hypothetical protein EV175_004478 [Coemansia sp. RSA 1933]
MKFSIAAISAFVALALGDLSINSPVAGTVWPYNGSSVTVSWVSSDGTALTGTVTIQLMEGSDSNNLSAVYTIATNYDASKGSISFVPPTNLEGSSDYAVRVTSSVDGPHYSHFFEAGNPAITGSVSTAVTVSQTSESSTTEASTTEESSTEERSSTQETTSKADSSSDELSDEISDDSSDEDESSVENSDESSEESSDDSTSSGASRPVIAAGIIGAAAIAALF